MESLLSGLFSLLLNAFTHLLKGLRDIAAGIVGKILGTFGLTMVSVSALLPDIKSYLSGLFTSIPANIQQMLGALGLDVAMTIICSALAIRMAWKVFIIPKGVADQIGV